MTVELRWPGKYDASGRRVAIPRPGAKLVTRCRFAGPRGAWVVEGDNLATLDALSRTHRGRISLVYLDPPFATGGDFSVLTRIGDDEGGGELEQHAYRDRFEDGLAGFLRMLDPRLRLLHEILADDGSLYLHVDPTVGHAVKLLLDEVFGAGSFQREIVWRIGWVSGFKTRARNWIRNHDLLFFYTKDPKRFTFNKLYTPYPPGYRRRDGSRPKGIGVPIDDVWNANEAEFALRGRESLDSIQIKSFSNEKSGYATQKNVSLLRRLIAASSNPGDVVLDPFCGSGTTAVAAAELGRRFIGGDRSPSAVHIAVKRLRAMPEPPRVDLAKVVPADDGPTVSTGEALEPALGDDGIMRIRASSSEVMTSDAIEGVAEGASTDSPLTVEARHFRLRAGWEPPAGATLTLADAGTEPTRREVPVVTVAAQWCVAQETTVRVTVTGYHYRMRSWLPVALQGMATRWSDLLDAWWIGVPDNPPLVAAHHFRTSQRRTLPLDACVVVPDGTPYVRVHLMDVLYREIEVLCLRNGEVYVCASGAAGS